MTELIALVAQGKGVSYTLAVMPIRNSEEEIPVPITETKNNKT